MFVKLVRRLLKTKEFFLRNFNQITLLGKLYKYIFNLHQFNGLPNAKVQQLMTKNGSLCKLNISAFDLSSTTSNVESNQTISSKVLFYSYRQ